MVKRLLIAVLMSATLVIAADAPTKYEPSEIQMLRLKVKLDRFDMSQQNLALVKQQADAAAAELNKQVADTEKENNWPLTLSVTRDKENNLVFSDPPPTPAPATPAPAKTPADKSEAK